MLVVAFVSFSLFNFVGDPINNMVGEETSDEERVELRDVFSLETKMQKAREARNPKTNEKIYVKEKYC